MSIIQNIRDKAAWLVFGVIALSLLGFLLMDAFVGKGGSSMMGGQSTEIGSVNGKKVNYIEYQKKVQLMEDQYKQSGYPVNEMMRQTVQEQVWNQVVEETVLTEQYEKLGLSVTTRELDDMLFGANPPQDIRQQFTNKEGVYDVEAAKQAIAGLRKQKDNPMAKNFNDIYLPALMESRLREKYASLLGNTYYIPKWLAEKMNADNNQLAAISFVAVPYATISDSSADMKVSDGDIQAYINKHADEFKQEASRSIRYVSFSAAPTSTDTATVKTNLENIRSEFASTPDAAAFLVRNNSDQPLFDGFVIKSKLQVPNADTIRELGIGETFGPYLDGGNFVIAKMLEKKNIPDSIKARHILVNIADRQLGQIRDDSTAKKLIDSIALAIKGGADFNELVLKYSDDQGSKNNRGEYEFNSTTTLVKPFYETVFYDPVGTKKVVKAESQDYVGYHYIEVLSQKNFEPAYKIAYLSKPVEASVETGNAASGAANQFAGEARNAKAFDETVTKRNLTKLVGQDIKPNDNSIPGLGSSRALVKWMNDAKQGEVSEVFNIEDKYVVAILTDINKEGTQSVAKARAQVEFIVRNQKKAESIKKKIGTANTLEAVAAATQTSIQRSDSVRFASPFIPNLGQELKVIGAAFNKDNSAKPSAPIAGNTGVFVIKTENVAALSDGGVNVEEQRNALMMQARQNAGFRSVDALRKSATIKDERSKVF